MFTLTVLLIALVLNKEYVKSNRGVYMIKQNGLYKIGRSNNIKRRMKEYSSQKEILDIHYTNNEKLAERVLINTFKSACPLIKGREWFNCNNNYQAKTLFNSATKQIKTLKKRTSKI